jgi:N6-L-threonylcarbamoyladenine synthase
MIVLGIESSCDETSIAVLKDGKILSNRIYTQNEHTQFGGVVPEIASREHIKKIDRLCLNAFEEAGISVSDVDLIAVTDRPGLAGALLVGISFAMGLHLGYGIPITGVNHLEGHIAAVTLEQEMEFPFLALVVSGGHSSIYKVIDFGHYTLLGQTIDDAAGEAYDKVGKMLGFQYPAGRDIEMCAKSYDGDELIPFPVAKITEYDGFNFSFSGLKTAVKYYHQKLDEATAEEQKPLICHSFQQAVIKSVLKNMADAVKDSGIKRIAMVGGVACNGTLRAALQNRFGDENLFFPSPILCTDNAAMIAKSGWESFKRGETRTPKMRPTSDITTKGR